MGLPFYYVVVSATDVNSVVTVDIDASDEKAFTLLLINDGANEVFVDFNNSIATSADFQLKSGEFINVSTEGGYDIRVFGIICSAGETATVRVLALPIKG